MTYDPYAAGYRAGAHGGYGCVPMFMTRAQAVEWALGFTDAGIDLAFYRCKPRIEIEVANALARARNVEPGTSP